MRSGMVLFNFRSLSRVANTPGAAKDGGGRGCNLCIFDYVTDILGRLRYSSWDAQDRFVSSWTKERLSVRVRADSPGTKIRG